MQVLIDYNNLTPETRRNGLKYVAEQIAKCLGADTIRKQPRLALRFYDGWYQVGSLTHLAQQTSTELQRDFPTTVSVRSKSGQFEKTLVAAEMAFSLHCDPSNHLWHTFRPRSGQSNVSCKSPTACGCSALDCPLAPLPNFFASQRCTSAGCTITTEDVIVRNEQKLVDSMMTTDLFSLHLSSKEELAIVSSDDDLWPAILLLLKRGHVLYHIHTKSGRSTPSFYSRQVSRSHYIQLHL